MLLVVLLSSFQISILFQDATDFEDRVPREAAMKIKTCSEQFSLADVRFVCFGFAIASSVIG